MACNKWESEGLLLTSGELSAAQGDAFLEHLDTCSVCHDEYHTYKKMQETFFTPELLDFEFPKSLGIFSKIDDIPREDVVVSMPLFTLLRTRVAPIFVLLLGVFLGYTLWPTEQTKGVVSTHQLQQAPSATHDSNPDSKSDTLREFREGGSKGIKSVDVTE